MTSNLVVAGSSPAGGTTRGLVLATAALFFATIGQVVVAPVHR
jgi:hypothetical protein